MSLFHRWFFGNENIYFLIFPLGILPRLSNYSQIVWSELGFSPFGHCLQVPFSAISLDRQALQVRRSAFGTSPGFGQSSHWPSLVIWFNGQAWQPRRSVFGTSPAFGQSWQLPLLMNWCNGQALQLRASSFGISPVFGQSSQLPLFVIWVAGHSSEKKTLTELVVYV